jgi:hypothetical protein
LAMNVFIAALHYYHLQFQIQWHLLAIIFLMSDVEKLIRFRSSEITLFSNQIEKRKFNNLKSWEEKKTMKFKRNNWKKNFNQ